MENGASSRSEDSDNNQKSMEKVASWTQRRVSVLGFRSGVKS